MGSKWSKESIEYSRKAEQVCNNYLMYLTGHTNNQWFSTLTQSAEFNRTDYSSIDSKNRTATIELKNRKMNINTYSDIMIEPEKLFTLTGATTQKSWYINFLNGSEEFWICDTKKLIGKKLRFKKNITITIKELGYDYTYIDDRYFIDKKDGHYFKINKKANKYEQIF